MDSYIDLLKVLLPELLITHFDMTTNKIDKDVLHLHFEDKIDIPSEFSSRIVIIHGFHQEITVQDFPIRTKKVYLNIKRRQWLDKNTKKAVQRDWNWVAQETCMTIKFAAFLKVFNNY